MPDPDTVLGFLVILLFGIIFESRLWIQLRIITIAIKLNINIEEAKELQENMLFTKIDKWLKYAILIPLAIIGYMIFG